MKWINGRKLGPYTVEKHELPRPSGQAYIPMTHPVAFIIHTTEGSSVAGALSTLGAGFMGPHFVVGEGRIVQTRPLDGEGATVHDHNDIGWQVECVGFSKQTVHDLTPESWGPLVELTRFMHEELGVPLDRPVGWQDNLSDIHTVLATNNTRRQSRKALGFRGVVGHLDVPDQAPTWHWDPGALDYSELFAQASGGGDEMAYADFKAGWKSFQRGEPEPKVDGDERFGWNAAQFAATKPVGAVGPKGDKGDPGVVDPNHKHSQPPQTGGVV
jgi:hypothetical protein